MSTTYTINFDFTDASQNKDLAYLQANNYQLLAFKAASGPNQVTAGVPVWFAESFSDMFGGVEIDYTPMYKVYVFNSGVIGEDTIIHMHAISSEIPLGSSLSFDQTGAFHPGTVKAPAGSIVVQDGRKAGSQTVTVGLAAYINGSYLPFCAFTSTPEGSIAMTPHETVCLFAANTNLKSGTVTAEATGPGVSFELNAATPNYSLAVSNDNSYSIISAGSSQVTTVDSGTDLTELLTANN